ncbi:MAG: uroporphyrinogen decarboxylase family protein [Kiritimatiellia bacterium]
MRNTKPKRLPIYEHIIVPGTMERILGVAFADMRKGDAGDIDEFFRLYCGFFKKMTYDVVSYEVCITQAMPDSGALSGGRPGPIQSRADFEAYPWADIPRRFWQTATPRFDALRRHLPAGMKAVGGIGNGAFEISEDLVGLEYLPFMQADDPELYADLFKRIGDLMCTIWIEFLDRYKDAFAACRFGDDLGFKSSLLTNPHTVRNHILPQYKRVIDIVHKAGRPFLLHSCGRIFEVMDDIIALGIDAKHSNEDAIAPFQTWIDAYGTRIGLLGGFDMDFLCSKSEDDVFAAVLEQGRAYRATARGYALGSGNSIPDYVPVQNYLAMVRAAQALRAEEAEE